MCRKVFYGEGYRGDVKANKYDGNVFHEYMFTGGKWIKQKIKNKYGKKNKELINFYELGRAKSGATTSKTQQSGFEAFVGGATKPLEDYVNY